MLRIYDGNKMTSREQPDLDSPEIQTFSNKHLSFPDEQQVQTCRIMGQKRKQIGADCIVNMSSGGYFHKAFAIDDSGVLMNHRSSLHVHVPSLLILALDHISRYFCVPGLKGQCCLFSQQFEQRQVKMHKGPASVCLCSYSRDCL